MMQLDVQFAHAQVAYPGNSLEQAGDRFLIQSTETGSFVAVIDGLGHGPKAADAALAAVDAFQADINRSVKDHLSFCSRSIRSTRGVAASIAQFSQKDSRLEWAGVGNVYAALIRSDDTRKHETLLTRGGVVGFRLPTIHSAKLDVHPYDLLVFATDGINNGCLEEAPLKAAPQVIADHILANHNRGTDDALVVVVRFIPTELQQPPV
ncbi:MAG: SpoIIE family protein phosphatase [Anaerolineae bacterium]|nr:SpoIIE family protein phosphatase [Anaerolineae bacterium]